MKKRVRERETYLCRHRLVVTGPRRDREDGVGGARKRWSQATDIGKRSSSSSSSSSPSSLSLLQRVRVREQALHLAPLFDNSIIAVMLAVRGERSLSPCQLLVDFLGIASQLSRVVLLLPELGETLEQLLDALPQRNVGNENALCERQS